MLALKYYNLFTSVWVYVHIYMCMSVWAHAQRVRQSSQYTALSLSPHFSSEAGSLLGAGTCIFWARLKVSKPQLPSFLHLGVQVCVGWLVCYKGTGIWTLTLAEPSLRPLYVGFYLDIQQLAQFWTSAHCCFLREHHFFHWWQKHALVFDLVKNFVRTDH